ncbi:MULTISPECIES: bifunctional proline dehydrogenase/L-glutamate gamma-semialdehyde dehydrogenase PutA [unclassified Halorhodospira]|uniref:bifunctional proline dehydrogenase/L-glutamate gamma-semialdehyde dehydrogenase PutA n=1 Tax=unclassified Halorhodospira TaxID=2626748 RepID=UPI001EE82C37|nr:MULTISPECIES: bifunctional proline dehydrogenase/L-glutamate gamma-semialdehyde dehydrogenase PutA [unclassified Halorhodospira]MCG5541161.1 bifunctional proline dehydrogenase/L-glutamate gamma-semialdehyde dehydrogenase PutA [Halorhodospira sp. M39old]MCG5545556.1 bifunctional proline dehydrogenase/L-glutamate gamma-semialdehyde dehydrogenase PutA [Halorhodospira sp. M38]
MSAFVHPDPEQLLPVERQPLAAAYRIDEPTRSQALIREAECDPQTRARIQERARTLVHGMIRAQRRQSSLTALLHEYDLSSEEGVALMCLAEALLRIPDAPTADRLIHDKLGAGGWSSHLGRDRRLLVNAATLGLALTGRILDAGEAERWFGAQLRGAMARRGAPLIRRAVRRSMGLLGETFVLGRDIPEAQRRARKLEAKGYRYSYDMLGEAARTDADAERFFQAYCAGIEHFGRSADPNASMDARAEVSVKLSALDPRFEPGQEERVRETVIPRLQALCRRAREAGIALCVDAEEAARLDLTLDVLEAVMADPELADWHGLGIAVQAYQKRAPEWIEWLAERARHHQRRLRVRLVKGAYWDTEVKDTQIQGLDDYPVFTRKAASDVCFLACARRMLRYPEQIYPQFATHNAHTVAAVLELAEEQPFEFQRLHGMADELYDQLVDARPGRGVPVRIYAPVGQHEALLPYLVRRLLENGANSSFVNRIHEGDVETLIADPVEHLRSRPTLRHPHLPLPAGIFGPGRTNSRGIDFSNRQETAALADAMTKAAETRRQARPIINGRDADDADGQWADICSPTDTGQRVGRVLWAGPSQLEQALAGAAAAWPRWAATPVEERARALERLADLYETHTAELMTLCTLEGGKTLRDGIAEVREAVDFCRYYAAQARRLMGEPTPLPGPTGETNALQLHGRGTYLCISPWNLPLAIFTGQITAALAAGNAVIAKPAEQTPLIAHRAVTLMHEAGIPGDVLHLLPGEGGRIGPPLVADRRIDGVAFTGSVATAQQIHRTLAGREGPIVPLIAETGGLNAMVVDSSALPEQAVVDVLRSAFFSTGQRCSALRLLCLQEDIAEPFLEMLRGAMDALRVGDPRWLATDIGPVIDASARARLEAHHEAMAAAGRVVHRTPLGDAGARGHFVPPSLYRLDAIEDLQEEFFGPMLHYTTWRAGELESVVERINAAGYGLTFGVHSRVDSHRDAATRAIRAGNAYVNRDIVGAVVGSQPFGGEGLSGTGFKAGGPNYLLRFVNERVVTENTAAAGGNASLFALGEDDET